MSFKKIIIGFCLALCLFALPIKIIAADQPPVTIDDLNKRAAEDKAKTPEQKQASAAAAAAARGETATTATTTSTNSESKDTMNSQTLYTIGGVVLVIILIAALIIAKKKRSANI